MRSTAGCLILTILLGICADPAFCKPKVKILKSLMREDLERDALQVALVAVTLYTNESDMAKYIRKEFDRRHRGTWQCAIGCAGFFVRYNDNSYIYFSIGDHVIVLFKTA